MRFAQVLHIAKRTGGDLIAITRMTADRISEKMEVKREILVMIAGKQMEAQIMKLMPLAIILYFWVFSPGFLDPLYRWEGLPCYGSSFTCLSGSSILDRSHQSY